MKLELNSRKSYSKRSCHINIRYFYIKDLVNKNFIQVKYCPTHKMITDFFTKPLQGRFFQYFGDFILGHQSLSELEIESNLAIPKEHVRIN